MLTWRKYQRSVSCSTTSLNQRSSMPTVMLKFSAKNKTFLDPLDSKQKRNGNDFENLYPNAGTSHRQSRSRQRPGNGCLQRSKSCFSVDSTPPPADTETNLAADSHKIDKLYDTKGYSFRSNRLLWSESKFDEHDSIDKLSKAMKAIIDANVKPDVCVYIGSEKIHCFGVLLHHMSEKFSMNNFASRIVMPPSKVTPTAFKMIYNVYLNNCTNIDIDDLPLIYSTARFLKCKHAENLCWRKFDDVNLFLEMKAYDLYLRMCEEPDTSMVTDLMLERIHKAFLTVIADKRFLRFPATDLAHLFSSDYIAVNSECDVFLAAALWLRYHWPSRKAHIKQVLATVRFDLVPCEILFHVYKGTLSSELLELTNSPDVKEIVRQAQLKSAALIGLPEDEGKRRNFIKYYGLKASKRRTMVVDKNCKYIEKTLYSDDRNIEMLFPNFQNYLKVVREGGRNYWRSLKTAH